MKDNKENKNTSLEILENSSQLTNFIKSKIEEFSDDSFYILDLAKVAKKFQQWKDNFPKTDLFYAVKCNADPNIIKFCANLGCGFDCASMGEITQILELTKINPDKIIYAHPCKNIELLKQAKEIGITKYTFDSVEELEKMKKYHPEADLVLRIKTADENSVIQFSKKFGADRKDFEEIIKKCQELNLNLIGVSFHVGTGSYDTSTFSKAVEDSSNIFEMAKKYGFKLSLIDIGGGFPGIDNAEPTFEEFANAVNESIKKHFGENEDLRIMGEPGRYMVQECLSLVAKVVSRNVWEEEKLSEECLKTLKDFPELEKYSRKEKSTPKYFIKESTTLSFSNSIFEDCGYAPTPIEDHKDEPTYPSNVYGISDCKHDTICTKIDLPILNINEFVYFENMGAYTTCIAKGMQYNCNVVSPKIYYYWCKDSLIREENFDEYLTNL